jgi:tetratricopeptide (TPR) repeat protein
MAKKRSTDPRLPKSLQEVLTAMGEKQRGRFGDYLLHELAHGQPRLLRLHALIEDHFFPQKPPLLSWEDGLSQAGIIPSQLDKLLSMLHQRLDQFLGLQQVLRAPHRHVAPTLEAYIKLKVDDATQEKKWRQLSKKLQSEPTSVELLRGMLDLEHLAIRSRISAAAPVEESHFAEINRLLDQHYLLNKLKYCCGAINEAQLLRLPFPAALVQQVEEIMRGHTEALPGWGLAYHAIYRLLVDPSQPLERYESALALLVAQAPAICKEDNFDLFNFLLNLCYRRTDVGDAGFEALVARLYRQVIDFDLLAVDGQIHPRTFKNVVSIHCRQGDFAWCRTFIAQHQGLLPDEDQGIVPAYCTGLVHFYEGEHAQAAAIFKEIIRLNPDDHFLSFESRNLLLKSYFLRYTSLTRSEHEDLFRMVDAFRMYARRNSKLDDFHRQSYLNFIQCFSQLLRHLDEKGGPFPEALRKNIEAEKMITNKSWLLSLFKEKF